MGFCALSSADYGYTEDPGFNPRLVSLCFPFFSSPVLLNKPFSYIQPALQIKHQFVNILYGISVNPKLTG